MISQKKISIEGKDFTINCSDLQCNWVLVYNNNKVLFVENVATKNCKLETRNTIFEASTQEECLAEIKRLNLQYDSLDSEQAVVPEENLAKKLLSKL